MRVIIFLDKFTIFHYLILEKYFFIVGMNVKDLFYQSHKNIESWLFI